MIYRKRSYTPPPMKRVEGVEYQITLTAPDGAKLRISYLMRDSHALHLREPRLVLADRLRDMRRTLRARLEQYKQGVEI